MKTSIFYYLLTRLQGTLFMAFNEIKLQIGTLNVNVIVPVTNGSVLTLNTVYCKTYY